MAEIDGQQSKLLRAALVDAFDENSFTVMLLESLDEKFDNLSATKNDFPFRVFQVIAEYNRREAIEQLIRAAQAYNPTNRKLRDLSETLHIGAEFTPAAYSDGELQRVIDRNLGFIDGRQFREKWARAERQVCRIEYPAGQHRGSGFLVGSDVVITNYHVMKSVIDDPGVAPQVVLRFDYEDNLAGSTSTTARLADDWRIDHSPTSPQEESPAAFDAPTPDQLDYTLLRLSAPIGDQPMPGSASAEKRGWVTLPLEPHDFETSPFLAIVQYPEDRMLRSTWDNQAFIKLNANGTRVRYRANTENGSSGSPCFNVNWELVALHHLGGPRLAPKATAFNQGIPFTMIFYLLDQHGVKGELGK